MSFDQFDEDQILNLDYADNNGRRRVGMSIDDRLDANVVSIYDWVLQRDTIGKKFLRGYQVTDGGGAHAAFRPAAQLVLEFRARHHQSLRLLG